MFDLLMDKLVNNPVKSQLVSKWTLMIAIIAMLFLSACDSANSVPAQPIDDQPVPVTDTVAGNSDVSLQPGDDAYPGVRPEAVSVVPVVVDDSGYPAGEVIEAVVVPVAEPVAITSIPSAAADTAVVTGYLLDSDGNPYFGTLYAAPTVSASDPNFPPLISFSEDENLLATLDTTTGQFYIELSVPGQYGLILWSPVGNTTVDNVETGESVLFTASSGETVDLGSIKIR